MKTRRVIGIVLIAAMIAVGVIRRHREAEVSCMQNVGPFGPASEANLNKPDLNQRLKDFYELCLRPDYEKGYVGGKDSNSETQAYALWQSYLANDKQTFERVFSWTIKNLKRDDNLLPWKFEVEKKGLLGNQIVISDSNSATDADTDMAYALFQAGAAFGEQKYTDRAKAMVRDIWDKETVELAGKRYAIAGNWADEPDRIIINPSYFSPQAYRMFALFDGEHDWNKIAGDMYELISTSSDHGANPRFPPNWIALSKPDARIIPYPDKPGSSDYGYDAFRVLWRIAYDQLKNPNFNSWNYVSSLPTFASDWQGSGEVCALYIAEDGGYRCDHSTTSTLAGPVGLFSVTNGFLASQVIEKYYIRDGKLQFPDTDFYAKSWHWFAVWLWSQS